MDRWGHRDGDRPTAGVGPDRRRHGRCVLIAIATARIERAAQPEAHTETQAEAKTEALAAEAQNPIANLISIPFQNNLTPGMEPDGDNTLMTRTILPVLSQPTATGTQKVISDFNPSFFFMPKSKWP